MLKHLLIVCLAALLIMGCQTKHTMAGQWKSEDDDGKEVVLFLKGNQDFEAISHGERLSGTWRVDEDVSPNQIHLMLEEGREVTSIVKRQGDSLLIEQVGENGEIPSKFTDKATYYKRYQ